MKSPAVFVLLPCELVNVETVQISAFCGYRSSQDVTETLFAAKQWIKLFKKSFKKARIGFNLLTVN